MTTLPFPLSRKFGHLRFIKKRGAIEYSSECPACSNSDHVGNDEPDRFRMFNDDKPLGWCRRCGHIEFANDDNPADTDPEKLAELQAVRKREAAREAERLRAKINDLQNAAYWLGWHDAMDERQRRLWREQGIVDFFINYYKLGYCADHTYRHDGRYYHSPSMTIPHYGHGWQLVNIQHRLLKPVAGAGKYRQMAGLPASLFRTEPDEPLTGPVLVVEGAKKAIVTYTHLGPNIQGTKAGFVGVTSKTPSADMLAELAECDPIYLALDPDAYIGQGIPAINRIVKRLGRERVLLVKLPCKPDDFFTLYGGNEADFRPFINQAVRC